MVTETMDNTTKMSMEISAETMAQLEGVSQELARREFREFLKYVWVFEPPPGRGKIKFEFWPHLEEMIEALPREPLIVWLKARRNGASWLVAAYVVFLCQQKGAYCPISSLGEKEAMEFLFKVKHVWANLPEELRWGLLTTDSRTELKWGDEGSHVEAHPSTPNAGRGGAITLAVIDEADFHEYLDLYYYAVKPSVDDSHGQLFMISTVNYATRESLFKTTYDQAPSNRFKKYFHGWRVRAIRDQRWYDETRATYPDKAKFEKENPETDSEALAAPRTLAAFSHDVLKQMQEMTRDPLEVIDGHLNIYQRPFIGRKYLAITDTSHGTGGDDAVTGVLDLGSGAIVADIQDNSLSPERLADLSMKLLGLYGQPLWAIEDNDWGGVTLLKAQQLKYPRLYYRKAGKAGWHTSEGNRFKIWGELIEAVNAGLITIFSKKGLAQFYQVIRNPEKEGRIEAQKGGHDDYPIMVGIGWQLRHHAYRSAPGPNSDSLEDLVTSEMGAWKRAKRW